MMYGNETRGFAKISLPQDPKALAKMRSIVAFSDDSTKVYTITQDGMVLSSSIALSLRSLVRFVFTVLDVGYFPPKWSDDVLLLELCARLRRDPGQESQGGSAPRQSCLQGRLTFLVCEGLCFAPVVDAFPLPISRVHVDTSLFIVESIFSFCSINLSYMIEAS